MEGRLMLSGSTPEAALLGEPAVATFLPVDQSVAVAAYAEGGWIPVQFHSPGNTIEFKFLNFPPSGFNTGTFVGLLDADGIAGMSTAVAGKDSLPAFRPGLNAIRSHGIEVDEVRDSLADWTVNDLRPITILQDPRTESETTIYSPFNEGASPVATSRTEGGVIPIEAIIASSELNGGMKTGRSKSLAHARGGILEQPAVPAQGVDDRAITAEWARAIAFETAGGEPAATTESLLSRPRQTESETSPREEELGTVQNATSAATVHPWARGERGFETATMTNGRTDLLQSSRPQLDAASHSAALAWVAGSALQNLSMATSDPVTYQQASSAHDEAFDQLVDFEHAASHWLGDYTRRALNATPLLLVLALDRVVSRRSSRRAGPLAANTPPRLVRSSSRADD